MMRLSSRAASASGVIELAPPRTQPRSAARAGRKTLDQQTEEAKTGKASWRGFREGRDGRGGRPRGMESCIRYRISAASSSLPGRCWRTARPTGRRVVVRADAWCIGTNWDSGELLGGVEIRPSREPGQGRGRSPGANAAAPCLWARARPMVAPSWRWPLGVRARPPRPLVRGGEVGPVGVDLGGGDLVLVADRLCVVALHPAARRLVFERGSVM